MPISTAIERLESGLYAEPFGEAGRKRTFLCLPRSGPTPAQLRGAHGSPLGPLSGGALKTRLIACVWAEIWGCVSTGNGAASERVIRQMFGGVFQGFQRRGVLGILGAREDASSGYPEEL